MRWVIYPFVALVALFILGTGILVTAAAFAWPKLPDLDALIHYRPVLPMRIYTADGYLLAEFGEEKRALIDVSEVPAHLKAAILATEDRRFYEHHGFDIMGIARAAYANLVTGDKGQGASTITMQVARNFFLTREKTYSRKLFELLLSVKIENNLTKDQIFNLYLNQIFLGERAYGFSAASQIYFGKPVQEINLAEAAMLAGLPQRPSKLNPVVSIKQAKNRQRTVLSRMLSDGLITQQQFQAALEEPIVLASQNRTEDELQNSSGYGNYVAEMARQIAVDKFGDQAYQLGLHITTTINRDDQIAAYRALRNNIFAYEERHGYRGPEAYIDLAGATSIKPEVLEDILARHPDYDDLLAAIVLSASPQKVSVFRSGQVFEITDGGLKFAASKLTDKAPADQRIRPGAIIRIQPDGKGNWNILQIPKIESALISINPETGAIQALVGGFDFALNKFNHVTQAQRQPGSAFKPFIYSAALEKGYSPASYESDDPLYFPASVTGGKPWTPKNYSGTSEGYITMRRALMRSKNLVSIRILQSITPKFAQDYITRFGFDPSQHPPYLTMALGAGSVTPWEMSTGYAIFANGGFRVEPYIVQQIADNDGQILARIDPPIANQSAPRVIDPRNAWLMNSMLQDVVRHGTAARANVLKRNDMAGKTGTTNDYVDAWFAGYTPDIVTICWIGFDQPRNMGYGETGTRAALPMWIEYMQHALKDIPQRQLPRPEGLVAFRPEGSHTDDYYYQENGPPAPLYAEIPDIPELQSVISGQMPGRDSLPAPTLAPSIPQRSGAPAPVEERTVSPARP